MVFLCAVITPPRNSDSFDEALRLHRQGQLSAARSLYERILQREPRHAGALHMLGVIAACTGRPRDAVQLITRAIASEPRDPLAHHHLGLALAEAGQPLAALASFERAAGLREDYAEPCYHAGNVLRGLGRAEQALASFQRAIARRPGYAQAWSDRGLVLCERHEWQEALAHFDRALALEPSLAVAASNRAMPLRELGRLEEAVASCDQALAVDPGAVLAWCNRGSALYSLRRVPEAVVSYDRALMLQPDHAGAHVNRGLTRLLGGDFAGGWADYEWRWRDAGSWVIHERRDFRQPAWRGAEPLAGRRILLYAEQGYGDTIQFCRFASAVAARGAQVILEVPTALVSLVGSLAGVHEVVAHGRPLPPFDYHCPLLSLPLALRTTLADVPAAVPYLHGDVTRRRHWAAQVVRGDRLRVGLVWSGAHRPARPELWSANARRNLPLALLAALPGAGVEYYSLQHDVAARQELAACAAQGWPGPAIRDLTAGLQDFADTAALIEALDLVITVDTAVAHLAGALGKPVWILNRHDACWRWLLDREDSPWYPTARLYRQRRPGDWAEVLGRVRADLQQLAGTQPAASLAPARTGS